MTVRRHGILRRDLTDNRTTERRMEIREATTDDAETLATLLASYLREGWPDHTGTGADVLRRDVLSGASGQRVLLAERRAGAIGFIAWDRAYDMHWAKAGVQIAELYVVPRHRGRGVALAMIAAMCALARRDGATFLRGVAYDRESPTGRFYERFAVGWDTAECTCAGRAFRTLADFHGKPVREILRALPPKEWNYEP